MIEYRNTKRELNNDVLFLNSLDYENEHFIAWRSRIDDSKL